MKGRWKTTTGELSSVSVTGKPWKKWGISLNPNTGKKGENQHESLVEVGAWKHNGKSSWRPRIPSFFGTKSLLPKGGVAATLTWACGKSDAAFFLLGRGPKFRHGRNGKKNTAGEEVSWVPLVKFQKSTRRG